MQHDFDGSTSAGQLRLMAVSMGLDSETYITRPLRPRSAAEQEPVPVPVPRADRHPLEGVRVNATWRPGRPAWEELRSGVVVQVSPVAFSDRLRLSVLDDSGNPFRCYTNDPEWFVAVAA